MGNSTSSMPVHDWHASCASTFQCDAQNVFVGMNGVHIKGPLNCGANLSVIPPEVWGVTLAACRAQCSDIYQVGLTDAAITHDP